MKAHSFHIPVMGLGFTVDTPLKVSKYGIDSVISLGDDILLEKLRKMYCGIHEIPYEEITDKMADYRAKRITSYLNLINDLVSKQFEDLRKLASGKKHLIKEYLSMLPDHSKVQTEFKGLMEKIPSASEIRNWINKHLSKGSIDVNIMTKLDQETYIKNEMQPSEFNYAHAALRGYANSKLSSSIVFSAGLNPRLYSYIEQFEDFQPNEDGEIKKKIVLKVSDYRSALIQGKFLAKKGLWVSEYRIESGLNCGGHAFATDGFLIGPILAEFKDKRKELIETVHQLYSQALTSKNHPMSHFVPPIKITAQGGVGTAEEHDFLIDHYQVDSVGWGSPFLLVPEATTVDDPTLNQLAEAKEDDLYLSGISPLGIPFNNLRGTTKGNEKASLIAKGKPGSPCVKRFLTLNREYSEKGLCTASSQYQRHKIKDLEKEALSPEVYQKKYDEIVDKECLCTGLGNSALINHDLDSKIEGTAVSVCPGPNIAYFSKVMSLNEITNHIYGRDNMIDRTDRPNMFMKELKIYIDYIKTKIEEFQISPSDKQKRYLQKFVQNLNTGIDYYSNLFRNQKDRFKDTTLSISRDLEESSYTLIHLKSALEA